MPLDDLLTFLATMFDLSWRVVPGQGEKPPSYELWQSPRQLAREREGEQERIRLFLRVLPLAPSMAEQMLSTPKHTLNG